MLEQKKLPILEALAAFGIGGIFTAACMAGLAYLMANQSLAQSTAWPMVSAIVCAGELLQRLAHGVFLSQQRPYLRCCTGRTFCSASAGIRSFGGH